MKKKRVHQENTYASACHEPKLLQMPDDVTEVQIHVRCY